VSQDVAWALLLILAGSFFAAFARELIDINLSMSPKWARVGFSAERAVRIQRFFGVIAIVVGVVILVAQLWR
jgi:hypothetical protein